MSRLALLWVVLPLLAGCAEQHRVAVMHQGQRVATLETSVHRPAGGAPAAPVVILLHGSSGGDMRARHPFDAEARFYTGLGYVVVAPMRRGRGGSTGVSRESESRNCAPDAWDEALSSAFEDLDAVFAFINTLPGLDSRRVVLHGLSRGGFLALAYAAEGRHRHAVTGVVNLVGGWVAQAEDQCPQDFNALRFARYGGRAAPESLWLYGAGDSFYGDDAVKSYPAAYRAAGGRLRFQLVQGVPGNGHWLPGHPTLWAPLVADYLNGLQRSARTAQ